MNFVTNADMTDGRRGGLVGTRDKPSRDGRNNSIWARGDDQRSLRRRRVIIIESPRVSRPLIPNSCDTPPDKRVATHIIYVTLLFNDISPRTRLSYSDETCAHRYVTARIDN